MLFTFFQPKPAKMLSAKRTEGMNLRDWLKAIRPLIKKNTPPDPPQKSVHKERSANAL